MIPHGVAQAGSQSEVDVLSSQAQEAMAGKNWAQAAKILEQLSELAPAVPEVQGNLGVAYYSENRVFDAAKAFERALKLNPNMLQAKAMLGMCYAELGRNREAVSLLAPVFRRPPDEQLGRLVGLDLQRSYAGLQEYGKATAIADEMLKRYPSDPEILFYSSRLHADASYQLMKQLMARSPDSLWSHYATAEVHESLQHYDLAIVEYRKVLEIDSGLPGIHFRLGRAILQSSKDPNAIDAAVHEFERELALSPDNSDADYEIGEIYRQRGQFEVALEHFSRAVHHHPDFVQARIGLASALLSQGKAQEALPHLLEAVRADPQNEVAHFRLAAAYKDLHDVQNQRREMAIFEELHSARANNGLASAVGSGIPQVTPQKIDEAGSTRP